MNGTSPTFKELYAMYYERILKYLSRAVGSDEAEDCIQEVFIRVLSSLEAFKGKSSEYTWIYRIATNLLIDRVRKRSPNGSSSAWTKISFPTRKRIPIVIVADDSLRSWLR